MKTSESKSVKIFNTVLKATGIGFLALLIGSLLLKAKKNKAKDETNIY